MNIKFLATAAVAIAVSGCSTLGPAKKTPEQLAKENYICDAKELQVLIGEQANDNTGKLALKKSHAKTLRWIPPNSAVTMDYRQDRLNISYDDEMKIQKVNCG
ncbi:MAG: I78 family peptidase inhibitor [Parasphingorhabdus sp.]